MDNFNKLIENLQKDREELRDHFQRGDIPEEEDFYGLINNMLSRKDDGVFKSINQPLSILSGSDKDVIHFYVDPEKPPKWKLSLDGGLKINLMKSTIPHFYIKDGGKVGIGTDPDELLHLKTDSGEGPVLKLQGPNNTDNGGRITFIDSQQWTRFFEILHDAQNEKLIFNSPTTKGIGSYNNLLVIDGEGEKIGIGIDNPDTALHILKTPRFPGDDDGPTLSIEGPRNTENGAKIKFTETHAIPSSFEILHNAKNNQLIFNSSDGNIQHDNILVIDRNTPGIGIGTNTPNTPLHIVKTDSNIGPKLKLEGPSYTNASAGASVVFTSQETQGFSESSYSIGHEWQELASQMAPKLIIREKRQSRERDLLSFGYQFRLGGGGGGVFRNTVIIGNSTNPEEYIDLEVYGNIYYHGSIGRPQNGDGGPNPFQPLVSPKDQVPTGDFKKGLETLRKINPVFLKTSKQTGLLDSKEKQYVGVLVKEVKKDFPAMVRTVPQKPKEKGKAQTEAYQLDSNALIYLLVNSAKEIASRLEKVEKELGLSSKPIPVPTKYSTKAEIKAYLTQQDIPFKSNETKAELLKKINK